MAGVRESCSGRKGSSMSATDSYRGALNLAFAKAQQFAAQDVMSAVIGGEASPGRDDRIGEVADVLWREWRRVSGDEESPRRALERFVSEHAPETSVETDLLDAIGDVSAELSDPGFLYGLAVGLAMRTGGVK